MSYLYLSLIVARQTLPAQFSPPQRLLVMKTIIAFSVLLAVASLSSLASSAALRPRTGEETKQNQYPWYYWNQDGEQGQGQGQYSPYYMQRCGAQGIDSLNLLSLVVVGMAALAFAGIPSVTESQLKKTR